MDEKFEYELNSHNKEYHNIHKCILNIKSTKNNIVYNIIVIS